MSKCDLKIGDIVKFTDNTSYVYTTSSKKTVGKIVSLEESDFYKDLHYYLKDKHKYYAIKILAMEDKNLYHRIIKDSRCNGIYPVEKEFVLPYDGEYDDIPNVKELLLKTKYTTIMKQKINKNKSKQYDVNKFLLGGF